MRKQRHEVEDQGTTNLRRYFTLAEANAQLVQVRPSFDAIMQLRTQAKKLHDRLDASGYPAEVDEDAQVHLMSADGVDMDDEPPPLAVLRWAGLLRAVHAALHEEIARILATGAIIDDLEEGTVNWRALHHGREIRLCWRYGEIEIGFWHDNSTTESQRPVSELHGDET